MPGVRRRYDPDEIVAAVLAIATVVVSLWLTYR